MKWIQVIAILFLSVSAIAQPRDLTPGSKKSAFGKRDFRNLSMYGLQFQFGPTYTLTRLHDKSYPTYGPLDGVDGSFTQNPSGRLGFYAELGMAHFPKKRSKLSLWLKTVLVSYYDWGLGYKHIGGRELTSVERFGSLPLTSRGDFYNGFVYGRFSLHKNIHMGKTFFLDNGLGINVDYKIVNGAPSYDGEVPGQRSMHDPLIVQLHYSLGFGFKLKRGSYFIPGIRTPILGYQKARGDAGSKAYFGNPAYRWFSSKYWPIYPHIKFIYLFEKKAKGCPAVETNDQDKETQRNR